MDKQNVEAIYIRGKCLYYQECLHTAFAYFQQVLRLAPDHTKALDIYKVNKIMLKFFTCNEIFLISFVLLESKVFEKKKRRR